MKDPKKDVPKAVIMSALAIASLYLISTLLIWAVVPASQISVSNGILQMFHIAFGVQGINAAVSVFIGILIIGTLFTGVVAWTLGQNRSIAEATASGEMPKVFGLMNRYDAPAGASVISGMISTAVIIIYWFFADTASEMFWHVTAFCLVVELLSYLVLFPAYIVLKKRDRLLPRPYKVPGQEWFAILLAVISEAFLLVTIIILCIQPGKDFVWTALPVIAGSLISVAAGEILINYSVKKYKHEVIS
jgi:amino acid transporter